MRKRTLEKICLLESFCVFGVGSFFWCLEKNINFHPGFLSLILLSTYRSVSETAMTKAETIAVGFTAANRFDSWVD